MRTYANTQKHKPYPTPMSEREELQNILWGINVSIPGSSITDPHHPLYVEMDHLRDMVQWQVEKVATEPEFQKGYISEDAREGFRQYMAWRERKQLGDLQFSVPGIPGMGKR